MVHRSGFMKPANALRLFVLSALVILVSACGNTPQAAAAPEQKRVSIQELRDAIDNALAAKGLANATVSIQIKSLKDGSVIYEKNPEQPLMPASNMKLVTTSAALEKLGKDYKYSTRFYLTANPDGSGVVNGSLVIKGAGDPNISGRGQTSTTVLLENAAQQLKAKGVKKITGDIIIDDTIFDREYVHPDWPADQMNRWYQAEVGGLSFNDDCIDFTVSPGDAGALAKVETAPATAYVSVDNSCKTSATRKGQSVLINREGNTNNFTVSGRIYSKAAPFQISLPIHDPGMFFGTVFSEVLKKDGVDIGGNVRLTEKSYDEKADNLVLGAELNSDLVHTITVANQRSQNFFAESMCKLLGHSFGAAGSWAEGTKVLEAYLNGIGVPKSNFVLHDGCGLSQTGPPHRARARRSARAHTLRGPGADIRGHTCRERP